MTTRYIQAEVEVDLDDFDDDDLIEACKERGLFIVGGELPAHDLREKLTDILYEIRAGRILEAFRRVEDLKEQCLRLEQSIAREIQKGSLEIGK